MPTLYVPRTTCTSSSLRMGTCFTCNMRSIVSACNKSNYDHGCSQQKYARSDVDIVATCPCVPSDERHSSLTEYFVRWSRDSGADMSFLRSLLGAVK
jgi:hypothetical protein